MRGLAIALSTVLLLLISATVVLADPLGKDRPGDLHAADFWQVADTIPAVVTGSVANKVDNAFDVVARNRTVHVTVDDNTDYWVWGKTSPTLADVKSGLAVVVRGTRTDNGILARWVQVIPDTAHFTRSTGTVVSFSSGNNIVVHETRGDQDRTFVVNSDTTIHLPAGQSAVQNGDLVGVISFDKNDDGTPIARIIVDRGAPSQTSDDDDDDDGVANSGSSVNVSVSGGGTVNVTVSGNSTLTVNGHQIDIGKGSQTLTIDGTQVNVTVGDSGSDSHVDMSGLGERIREQVREQMARSFFR